MSVRNWFRGLFAGPTTIGGGDPEAAAALREEDFGVQDAGEADLESIAEGRTPAAKAGMVQQSMAVQASLAASEAAETAMEDLETEEAPPDPNP